MTAKESLEHVKAVIESDALKVEAFWSLHKLLALGFICLIAGIALGHYVR